MPAILTCFRDIENFHWEHLPVCVQGEVDEDVFLEQNGPSVTPGGLHSYRNIANLSLMEVLSEQEVLAYS